MYNFWSFLHQTVAVSATAVFLLILKRIFLDKLSPRWQYGVWGVLLLRLVVPVGWLGHAGALDLVVGVDLLRILGEMPLSSAWSSAWAGSLPTGPFPWLPSAGAPKSVTDWLFLIYLLGVVLCALWLVLGWLRLRRGAKDAVPVAGVRLAEIEVAAREFSLNMPHRVVESRSARTPFVMGVFHPVLVLPMGWEVDRKVVLHELLHLKYQDVAAGWVTTLFRCIHWCNPLLWWVFDRIGNDREALCDQRVLERLEGEERRDYGRVLLSMAEDGALRVPGATTMANGGQNIKARIQSIARFKTFPQGMGLVSGCIAVMTAVSLVVGTPAAAQGNNPGLGFLTWFGPGGQLVYAMSNRATTVAGALDAYSKGVYYQYQSPNQELQYKAMVTSTEELPTLLADWKAQVEQWDQPGNYQRHDLLDAAYRTGPIFRGLTPDGEGGYWTQMYFFRDEHRGTRVGWQRHTLHLQPQEGGAWTVTPLSTATGLLPENFREIDGRRLDRMITPIPEPPIFTWTGEVDGVEVELWPEACLQVQDAYINGSAVMELELNDFGFPIHTDRPDLDANFSIVKGLMRVQVTNLTTEPKSFALSAAQFWDGASQGGESDPFDGSWNGMNQGGNYTGYDLDGEPFELAPGESKVIYHGGRGKGRANSISPDDCIMAAGLVNSYYTDEQGNEYPLDLTREVNLK